MVKAGIFLLFRFTPLLGLSDIYVYIVTFVGLITMLLVRLPHYDNMILRHFSLFYYQSTRYDYVYGRYRWGLCTTYLRSFVRVLRISPFAGLFHLMNHAVLNVHCSWCCIIDHESGTRDIRSLNGMRHVFPKMHIVMLLVFLWQGSHF